MGETATQEYDEQFVTLLEAIWGEGFLSPGGVGEVDQYLDGIKLEGLSVLDIGCGLGGVDVHLVKQHKAAMVTGIDIEPALVEQCETLAKKYKVDSQTRFICVEPGPLPFADHSFDIVTSKDSIIHIPQKQALAVDIYRVLKPGGWFVASDWLSGYDDKPSPEMQDYLIAEGLDFGLSSAKNYQQALEHAGFSDIRILDRNNWYQKQARHEREQLQNDIYDRLVSKLGKEFLVHEIDVWDKMIVAIDQGQLRPSHLRGRKPA